MAMTLGDFTLTTLSDGTFRLDGGAMFGVVPKPLWARRAPADARNRIALGLRPLLVRTRDRLVLIDAGIGEKMPPKDVEIYAIDRTRSLDHALAGAGVAAADIDVVVASHLHFDHMGGGTRRDGAAIVPRFPRARYLIRRGEWDDATHPHERNRASYLPENLTPLADAGVIDFIDADAEVCPGIRVRRTGGHTRHHQIVEIASGGRTAVFTADLIPTTAHLDPAWVMGYDLYPMDTLGFKRAFVEEAIEREYVIFFEHDPAIAAGVIRRRDGRRVFEPVEA